MPYPDSPEAVALELARWIVHAEGTDPTQLRQESPAVGNRPVRAYLLDVYAEALLAVQGRRKTMAGDTGPH